MTEVRPPTVEPPGRLSMRKVFWLPLWLTSALVMLALLWLVGMSWRTLGQLRPVQEHLGYIIAVQDVSLDMEQALLKDMRGAAISAPQLATLQQEVQHIAGLGGALHPHARQRLAAAAKRLSDPAQSTVDQMFEALAQVKQVLADERTLHDNLLQSVVDNTRVELRLSVILLIVLPIAGGLGMLLLQMRTEQPLRDLQDLLDRLSERDLTPLPPAEVERTARLARPAFQSYNVLVSRLQELEAEHRDREGLLEQRVRDATAALLAQSRELSRAERLAAVGAVSAGLAHELRNPLAGIQLACSKMQHKLEECGQSQRIGAVIGELKRINNLLTEQVDAARHAPEVAVPVQLEEMVGELLGLLRYQVPAGFVLETQIDERLQCTLPLAGLRQALLNLLLNAVQIQGDSGHVLVSAVSDGERLVLQVADQGPGFPETMLRAGIRPFATGRSGGTGLGLAMVRRFVRDLDGDLLLANRTPHGALVTLSLPCHRAS
jgi:two-component system, NtrC family, sensor kinase